MILLGFLNSWRNEHLKVWRYGISSSLQSSNSSNSPFLPQNSLFSSQTKDVHQCHPFRRSRRFAVAGDWKGAAVRETSDAKRRGQSQPPRHPQTAGIEVLPSAAPPLRASDSTSASGDASELRGRVGTVRCWKFRYSYWGSRQSYVLTKGWSTTWKRTDSGPATWWCSTATG